MNCFTKQRIVSLLMVGSLMVGMSPSVLALDGYNGVKDIPGVGNSEVTLTVENTGGSGGGDTPVDPDVPPVDPTIFSAYVPAELPIKMDLDGNIVVPDNVMIINAVETKGICVTDIGVTLESGWSAANWDDDFISKEENSKELGLKLRSDYLSSDGSFNLNSDDWKISKNSYINLNMGAKLPKQTEAGSKGKIATISFTLDWSGDDVTVGPEIPGGNPNGGGSGGGSETPVEPVGKVSVKFVSDENGSLEGETELVINSGDTVSFPTANPKSIRYELSNWVDTSTNNKVSETTPIVEDTTIKAVFDERAASPKNWFTTDGQYTITGLSAEYLNMVDAPTDLVIPDNIGGSTITTIGDNAFQGKNLITSIVLPSSIKILGKEAFMGCRGLTDLLLPDGLVKIDMRVFEGCTNLKIVIPDSVSNQMGGHYYSFSTGSEWRYAPPFNGVKEVTIGKYVELDCNNDNTKTPNSVLVTTAYGKSVIGKVIVKDGVTKIGDEVFANNTVYADGREVGGIGEVYLPNSVLTISDKAFHGVDKIVIDNNENNVTWNKKPIDAEIVWLR